MLAVSAGVAVFLTLSGAFGLGGAPLAARLAYWLGLLLFGSALSLAGQAWIARRPSSSSRWVALAGLVLAMTAAMTPVVFLATRLMFGGGWGWGELAGFVPPVLVVSVAMTALNVLTLRARAARRAEAVASASPPEPEPARAAPSLPPLPLPAARFRERLPARLRGAEIHAVEAEDHYLRVHTDRGGDLLLMRLADALEELAALDGARTHRSWWVARAAVEDVRRGDGRAVLRLKGGVEAPVSRSYAPALREAGWF